MKINSRQLCVIVFYILTSLKLFALPSLIYVTCETDSWMVFVFMILIDICLTLIIFSFLRQSSEKNFYKFLKNRFGVVFAKIFCFSFFVVFMLDLLDGTTGLQRLLLNNFYIEFRWYVFLIPQLSIMAYIVYKGLRNIGRLCEIFIWLIIAGIIFIILKSLTEFDPTFFLPVLSTGFSPIIKALFKHITWFGTPISLLFMMGDIDFKDYKTSRLVKYLVIAGSAILISVVVFYGVFKSNAGLHSFAISDLSEISNSSTALDELSWFIVSIWVIGQTLQLSISFYAVIYSFRYLFNINNSWFPIVVVSLLVVFYQAVNNNSLDFAKYFYSTPVAIVGVSVKIGLVLFMALANLFYLKRKRRKTNGKA